MNRNGANGSILLAELEHRAGVRYIFSLPETFSTVTFSTMTFSTMTLKITSLNPTSRCRCCCCLRSRAGI